MSSTTTNALWRRLLLVGIATLVALLAVSFTAPQEAQAIMDPTTVTANRVGWVKTRPLMTCLAMNCPAPTHTAYRWTGSAWQTTQVGSGIDVYVYPYSAPWHWIWTQRTGWLAIHNSALETGYRCYGYACPVF